MSNSKYDFAVAYRIYPKVSKVPPVYGNDKYLLSELCLHSFAKSLKGLNPKIYVILDTCPSEYDHLFKNYLSDFDFELIHAEKAGNAKTFEMQMDILLNQKDSEIIYFAEDDYFYLENSFKVMLELIKSGKADYISPYDHIDCYNHRFHNYKSDIIFQGTYWRTILSTTMTFMTIQNNLRNTQNVFNSYLKNNSDASLWASICGNQFRNPSYILNNIFADKDVLRFFVKSYVYNPIITLFGKKYKLMSPLPSLALHMEKEGLSPGINWQNLFISNIEEINNAKNNINPNK